MELQVTSQSPYLHCPTNQQGASLFYQNEGAGQNVCGKEERSDVVDSQILCQDILICWRAQVGVRSL